MLAEDSVNEVDDQAPQAALLVDEGSVVGLQRHYFPDLEERTVAEENAAESAVKVAQDLAAAGPHGQDDAGEPQAVAEMTLAAATKAR